MGAKDCAWCNRPLGSDYIVIEGPINFGTGAIPKGYEVRFCSIACSSGWERAGRPDIRAYKKGDCFITTAVCKTLNKPDDCAELTVLRNFRNTFMQETPERNEEVREYYHTAPQICAEIEKAEDSGAETYTVIWEKYLKPAVDAVERKENQKAHDIYKQMVLDLKREYLD